jgi:hypothetical protein
VVLTTQHGLTDQAAVTSFEMVLRRGQSAAVSIPRGAGEAAAQIVLGNSGDYLHITEPKAAFTARLVQR